MLDSDDLRQLDGELRAEVLAKAEMPKGLEDYWEKELVYVVQFSDGSNLRTISLDEILNLPNSPERRITSITVNTPSWYRYLTARVSFRSYSTLPSVEYEVSGEASAALHLADKLDQRLLGLRQWYTPILRVNFFYMALLLVFGLILYATVAATVNDTPNDANLTWWQASLGLFLYFVAPLLVATFLDWLRRKLFPTSTFAIGQGVGRNKTLNFWRVAVLLALLVSVISGLIVEGLLFLL